MADRKTIYCPKCGRKVAAWDGRSTNNISVKCKKCNKLVIYFPEKGSKAAEKCLPQLLFYSAFLCRKGIIIAISFTISSQ